MGWRKRLEKEPHERDPRPIYVAAAGLTLSVASYWIPSEDLAGTLYGSGLITAAFCLLYWIARPPQDGA
ncbi:hypothetical protein [Methylocystis echinoides]|uniref:hypothetical protein n=1 Tax=Methylocystis echinoides TaxID=29468 RepID=UPI00342A9221